MKKISLLLALLALLLAAACSNPRETSVENEELQSNLPQELKGLKVYTVYLKDGNYIKIAVLNNNIVATDQQNGEVRNQNAIINQTDLNKVIFENDSIMIIRK